MPEMVAVACKLPNGAHLRLYDMVDGREPVMGGGFRDTKIAQIKTDVSSVVLHGCAIAKGERPSFDMAPGAAITMVRKDFMDEWFRQNASHPWVVNRMIFYNDKKADTTAEAKNDAKHKSGQQPLMQVGDPRAKGRFTPKPFKPNDMDADAPGAS